MNLHCFQPLNVVTLRPYERGFHMITTRSVFASIAMASFMSVPGAQGQEIEIAPLKNWPAPLYWQSTEAEESATVASSDTLTMRRSASSAAANLPLGTNALVFVGMTPCRVVDTRSGLGFSGAFGPPRLAGGSARTFPIQSSVSGVNYFFRLATIISPDRRQLQL